MAEGGSATYVTSPQPSTLISFIPGPVTISGPTLCAHCGSPLHLGPSPHGIPAWLAAGLGTVGREIPRITSVSLRASIWRHFGRVGLSQVQSGRPHPADDVRRQLDGRNIKVATCHHCWWQLHVHRIYLWPWQDHWRLYQVRTLERHDSHGIDWSVWEGRKNVFALLLWYLSKATLWTYI